MAWNEPGGNGDKDPWGNRGNQDGPPDLDEIVRKMQDKVGGLFGGRGSSSSGTGDSGPGARGAGIIALILLLLWLAWDSAYIIQPAQRGVVLRFGAFQTTIGPGLNFRLPRPFEQVEVVDVDQIRSISHKATMLTQDENIVDVEVAVQYRVKGVEDYLFKVLGPDQTLRQATESSVREVIGKSKMDYVLTEGRNQIATKIKLLMQGILDSYKTGLFVNSVNMQPAKPPEQVKSAFDDAIKAREDEQRKINEAEAYRNEILPKARGAAARQSQDAKAYKARVIDMAKGEASRFTQLMKEYQKAPEVTRERLYLETMESVLSNTSKVYVDTEGNNNLLYLPVDKLLENQAAGRKMTRMPGAASDGKTLGQDIQDMRQRTDTRNRDSRRDRGSR